MTADYQLIIEQGPRRGQTFPLENSVIIIGRDPLVDISIADPEVSRQHARLARNEDGTYKIQDLGSTNGTFVNGQRVSGEPYVLSAGQEVVLGSSVVLRFGLVDEAVDSPEPPLPFPVSAAEETAVALEPDPYPAADPPEEPAPFNYLHDTDAALAAPQQTFVAAEASPPRAMASPGEPLRPPAAPFVPAERSEREPKRKKTITWVLVTVLLLMLCCCGFLLSAWYWWGDPLMEALGIY